MSYSPGSAGLYSYVFGLSQPYACKLLFTHTPKIYTIKRITLLSWSLYNLFFFNHLSGGPYVDEEIYTQVSPGKVTEHNPYSAS